MTINSFYNFIILQTDTQPPVNVDIILPRFVTKGFRQKLLKFPENLGFKNLFN